MKCFHSKSYFLDIIDYKSVYYSNCNYFEYLKVYFWKKCRNNRLLLKISWLCHCVIFTPAVSTSLPPKRMPQPERGDPSVVSLATLRESLLSSAAAKPLTAVDASTKNTFSELPPQTPNPMLGHGERSRNRTEQAKLPGSKFWIFVLSRSQAAHCGWRQHKNFFPSSVLKLWI